MDTVSREVRSRIMSRVRGKNTKPEVLLRKALHSRGFRYVLHPRSLPGCPDIVLPKYRAVVFVHGCFWHAHGCRLSTTPTTRREFWTKKFEVNRSRDARVRAELLKAGWRVAVVWQCVFTPNLSFVEKVQNWLQSKRSTLEVPYGVRAISELRRPQTRRNRTRSELLL
jgi:DNA mismatch endonuclease, patch repair protein